MTIEEENIQLVLDAIKERIKAEVNTQGAFNGYARACGALQGVLEGLVKHVPEAREYFIKYYTYFNKEN